MSDWSGDMGSNGRMTDDEARGGIGTITRPAARQGDRPRLADQVSAPAERRGRQARPDVPPQRGGTGRPAQGPRRTAPGRPASSRPAPSGAAEVSQTAPQGAGPHRGPFVVLLCGLLGGALVSALVISTTLAQGAFQISKLQDSTGALARQRQALAEQVAQAQSAQEIEQRASQLGMRPVGELRFIDLKTGKIRTDAGTGFVKNINVPGYTP